MDFSSKDWAASRIQNQLNGTGSRTGCIRLHCKHCADLCRSLQLDQLVQLDHAFRSSFCPSASTSDSQKPTAAKHIAQQTAHAGNCMAIRAGKTQKTQNCRPMPNLVFPLAISIAPVLLLVAPILIFAIVSQHGSLSVECKSQPPKGLCAEQAL